MHHEEINKDPQRINKFKPYVSNYNWKGIGFPAKERNWKVFEKNNKDIALNIFSAQSPEKKINLMRKSEHNSKRKKIVDLLMITDEKNNWHYAAIKNMKRLIRGVVSIHHGDFFCRNCMHLFRTSSKLKNHERLCLNHNYYETIMPKKDKNILKFNSNQKSLRPRRIIYADLEALRKEIQSCQPNRDGSYTEDKNEHIACSYALHMIRTYDNSLITS